MVLDFVLVGHSRQEGLAHGDECRADCGACKWQLHVVIKCATLWYIIACRGCMLVEFCESDTSADRVTSAPHTCSLCCEVLSIPQVAW